jgi:hypothetical protein
MFLAGLGMDDDRHYLFLRQSVIDSYNKLDDFKKNGLHFQGSPGTGKSTTTWLWALKNFAGKKSVLWIHLTKIGNHTCLRLSDSSIKKAIYTSKEIDQLQAIISQNDLDIIIIDGVLGDVKEHTDLTFYLLSKLDSVKNQNKLHIVIVSSLAFDIDTESELERLKVEKSDMDPWSLEEYKQACNNEEFLMQVYSKLIKTKSGIEKNPNPNRTNRTKSLDSYENEKKKAKNPTIFLNKINQLIENKFYYAGCSVRWMFEKTYDQVINYIGEHMRALIIGPELLNGKIGDKCLNAKNHLIVNYRSAKHQSQTFFTSKYICEKVISRAATQLDVIDSFYKFVNTFNNNSFLGWLFEADFFQQLATKDVDLFNFDNSITKIRKTLKKNEVLVSKIDFDSLHDIIDEIKKGKYVKSEAFNQPGWDFFQIEKIPNTQKNYHLKFGQVTVAQTHECDLIHFADLRTLLVKLLRVNPTDDPAPITSNPNDGEITAVSIMFFWPIRENNNLIEDITNNDGKIVLKNPNALQQQQVGLDPKKEWPDSIRETDRALSYLNKFRIKPSGSIN